MWKIYDKFLQNPKRRYFLYMFVRNTLLNLLKRLPIFIKQAKPNWR